MSNAASNVVAMHDDFEPPDQWCYDEALPADDWREALLYRETKDGRREIISCSENIVTILRRDPDWHGVLAWDELNQQIALLRAPPWRKNVNVDAREMWRDSHATRLQMWLARRYTMHVSTNMARDAAVVTAEENPFNPAQEWADALPLDPSRKLVDTWMHRYLGAVDDEYTRMVGRCFLISAMARIYQPGCKVDTMPVLEGDQGIRKSTALRALFGDAWFSDTPLDLMSKDRFVSLRGLLCHEVAELDSFSKADTARIKSFLSSQLDDYRPPYGQTNVKVPRRCVFVGTVNPGGQGYLRDDTGNRRFWPVRCGVVHPINATSLRADRDVLWAEARELYRSGLSWWPDDTLLESRVKDEQAQRMTVDAWQDKINEYLSRKGPNAFVKIGDVLSDVLSIDIGKWTHADQCRVASCMIKTGWVRRQRRVRGRSDGSTSDREWGYVPRSTPAYPETDF